MRKAWCRTSQASTRAYHKLRDGAKSLGIRGRLRSSNKIRFMSFQMKLQSVIGLEAAFTSLLNTHGNVMLNTNRPANDQGQGLLGHTEVLNKILVPLSKIMTAIQAQTATLADITSYWLYQARVLRRSCPSLQLQAVRVTTVLLPKHCHFQYDVCQSSCAT